MKTCGESGVRELQLGGLRLAFYPNRERLDHQLPEPTPQSAPVSPDQAKTISQEELEKQEIELREEQISELLVHNPRAYEEMLAKGDLAEPLKPPGDGLDGETEED